MINPAIPGLLSSGPDPKLNDQLMLFGKFVGSWEIKAKYYSADGSQSEGSGEVHFGWILDGKAIQDVWLSNQGTEKVAIGTTLRYFEPNLNAWRCIWIAPMYSLVQSFVAREMGAEIVLEAQNQAKPEKWIWSQITPESFHWRAIENPESSDDWRLTEEMWISRVTR